MSRVEDECHLPSKLIFDNVLLLASASILENVLRSIVPFEVDANEFYAPEMTEPDGSFATDIISPRL